MRDTCFYCATADEELRPYGPWHMFAFTGRHRSRNRGTMKFLTIRQPWASLIAVGAKTIETRPFSTKYRGPLAIHAGKFEPVEGEEYGTGWWWCWDGGDPCIVEQATDRFRSAPAPLGAVVAVCDLVDVVPIETLPNGTHGHVGAKEITWKNGHDDGLMLWECCPDGLGAAWRARCDLTDQIPFGDFTPGRYAWLLDNVRAVDPVLMKGAQGLRDVPPEIAEQINPGTEGP